MLTLRSKLTAALAAAAVLTSQQESVFAAADTSRKLAMSDSDTVTGTSDVLTGANTNSNGESESDAAESAALRVLADGGEAKKDGGEADASKETVHLAAWGEAEYWLKLEDLRFSEGTLDPEFNPEWAGPYDLLISSPAATNIVITPVLNIKKYIPRYPPRITLFGFNYGPTEGGLIYGPKGHNLKYSPVRSIQVPLTIRNGDHGPLNQEFHIMLDDPEAGYRSPQPMKYKIKFQQPPAATVVSVLGFKIVTPEKKELHQAKTWARNQNKYMYLISADIPFVDIHMECDPAATSISFNGEYYHRGEPHRLHMYGRNKVDVLCSCNFGDKRWTKGNELSRTYLLRMQGIPKLPYQVKFILMASGSQGICHKTPRKEGYSCEGMPIVGSWGTSNDVFIQGEGGEKIVLTNGIPRMLPNKEGTDKFTIVIQGNGPSRRIPLEIKTKTHIDPAKAFAPETVDLGKVLTVQPAIGEGHCRLEVFEKVFYCHANVQTVHLVVISGRKLSDAYLLEGLPKKAGVADSGAKLFDHLTLGLPSRGVELNDDKTKAVELTLNLERKGMPWRAYGVVIRQRGGTGGGFLPMNSFSFDQVGQGLAHEVTARQLDGIETSIGDDDGPEKWTHGDYSVDMNEGELSESSDPRSLSDVSSMQKDQLHDLEQQTEHDANVLERAAERAGDEVAHGMKQASDDEVLTAETAAHEIDHDVPAIVSGVITGTEAVGTGVEEVGQKGAHVAAEEGADLEKGVEQRAHDVSEAAEEKAVEEEDELKHEGEKIKHFAEQVGGDTAREVEDDVGRAANAVGHDLGKAADDVKRGVKDVAHDVKNAAHDVKNVGSDGLLEEAEHALFRTQDEISKNIEAVKDSITKPFDNVAQFGADGIDAVGGAIGGFFGGLLGEGMKSGYHDEHKGDGHENHKDHGHDDHKGGEHHKGKGGHHSDPKERLLQVEEAIFI